MLLQDGVPDEIRVAPRAGAAPCPVHNASGWFVSCATVRLRSTGWMYSMAWLLAILFLTPSLVSADVSKEGELSDGKLYSVEIRESRYLPSTGESPDDGGRWGIDGGFPRTSTSSFRVTIDGNELSVPRKLFADLSSVVEAIVSLAEDGVRVTVRGGDGSGSYEATFAFREDAIERIVKSGEAPESIWERTTIHYALARHFD